MKIFFLITTIVLFMNAQEIKGNASNQTIDYKGEAITVPVSAEQSNRITLPSRITDKLYSKEKNLIININGNQAFVKFAPIVETTKLKMDAEKEAKTQKTEIIYQKNSPTELHLVTEDDVTYTFILIPTQMDTQTIIVTNSKQKKKELSYKETLTPFKNLLDDLTKKILINEIVFGYEEEKKDELVASSPTIDINLKKIYRGSKLDVFKYELKSHSDKGEEVQERDLIPLVNKSIYRIVLYYDNEVLEIPPHGTAQALIFVQGNEEEVKK